MFCFQLGTSIKFSILFLVVHRHVLFDDALVAVDCGRLHVTELHDSYILAKC